MDYEVPNPSPSYFFLDGTLYKVIRIVKTRDQVYAWDFQQAKRVLLSWSWLQRSKEYAFTVAATARLIDRPKKRIELAIRDGLISPPHQAYHFKTGNPTGTYYSESHILDIHEAFSNMHKGHPRKDGINVPSDMPSRQELLNMMDHKIVTYVKTGDKFVPIWKAGTW